ncbi:hypothetical protein GUITHDRAFT_147963 [Guillardia theta CCMP2712]|uniref:Uncharacterized protein n=1 Tax=Guillardia theta (strain CCMP2712) TaxID=905079 RepID=L1IBT1_GUITC|nr:hypothetical protein GUITHDRAFT_147963 [Guillardia theta CCMP2712]EKX33374.1 hypothetical protein GUITHDRAFT_147963 [Guillardia theta CCMP2712]|eukprot:XP_005820354.1 hypothetical protein GUITHDRAFT_147963 [Guillardia theta CCMP2712]
MSSDQWRKRKQRAEHDEADDRWFLQQHRKDFVVGRGLGVAEWINLKQPVERRWHWDVGDDEKRVGGEEEEEPSHLPSLLRRFLPSRSGSVRSSVKEEGGDEGEGIPTTLAGLMYARVKETLEQWRSRLQARREYQKRLRTIYGPGPVEQVFTWYVLVPLGALLAKLEEYFDAYLVILRLRFLPSSSASERGMTWRVLEKLQNKVQLIQSVCVGLTVCVALIVYEFQFRGYVPSWSEDCRNPFSDPATCVENSYCSYQYSEQDSKMQLSCLPITNNLSALTKLKVMNVALTLLMIWNLFVTLEYENAIRALRNHVEFRDKKLRRYSMIESGLLLPFLVEAVSLAIVQIPFLQFDVIVQTSYFSTRPSMYSFDGIIAIVMTCRTYQVWKWYRSDLFAKFESRQYGVRINDDLMGSWLAIRFLILKNPFLASFQFFLALILVGSYVFRIAESSTNSVIAVYYWDSLWFVMDTALGLPVGEVDITPSTSFGRFIAIAIRLLSILWFALLVAAIRLLLRFDAKEIEFFGWLRLSKLFQTLRTSAARVIQYLWMYRRSWLVERQRTRFRRARRDLMKFESGIENPERWDFGAFTRAESRRISEIKSKVSSYANLLEKVLDRSGADESYDMAGVMKRGGGAMYYSDTDSESGEELVMLSGVKFGSDEDGKRNRSKQPLEGEDKYGGMNYEVMLTKKEKRIRRRKQLEEQIAVCSKEAGSVRKELEKVVDKEGKVVPPEVKEIQPWEQELIAKMDERSRRLQQAITHILTLVQGLYHKRGKAPK